jgi:hypothetical protein
MGANLVSFDDTDAKKLKGYVQTVRQGNFLAVVCKDEWSAVKAAKAVKTTWSAGRNFPLKRSYTNTGASCPLQKPMSHKTSGTSMLRSQAVPSASKPPITLLCKHMHRQGLPVRLRTFAMAK